MGIIGQLLVTQAVWFTAVFLGMFKFLL